MTRLQEARTQEFVVIGEFLPASEVTSGGGIGTGTNLAVSRVSDVLRSAENATNLHKLNVAGGFDAAWEIDLFGKFQRELEAVILVTVAADVARAYLDMRALQRELAVVRNNIGVAKSGFDPPGLAMNEGSPMLDVALAERHFATLQANVAPLEAQVGVSQHVIAVLLAQFPEALAKELASPGKIPVSVASAAGYPCG